jgi:hypothetical protein
MMLTTTLPEPVKACRKMMSWRRVYDVMPSIFHHTCYIPKNQLALREVRNLTQEKMFDRDVTYNDLTIQFIGASGLPKMDVVGSADPYFIADLDGQISIV